MNRQNTDSQSAKENSVNRHEVINSLFQPDTLAPQQFLDTFQRTIPSMPETRLVLAVLEDAIHSFKDNLLAQNKKKKQLFQETEEWFYNDDASWLFSFVCVCETLNIEPNYFRQGLKRWASQRLEAARKVHPAPVMNQDRLVA
jgi:hypothetical protein